MNASIEPAEYCRQVESYLCRKNEGHLIRIVGPVFEQVCGWAMQGVPLTIAFRGIDQYCERYYAKGPRRRPVRIEFCEADVFDLFDAWRRAVGVTAVDAPVAVEEPAPRKPSLASHIERVIARLASARTAAHDSPAFAEVLDAAVRELEGMSPSARQARGEARSHVIEALARIDRGLLEAAIAAVDENTARSPRRDAESELAPFGGRLASDARTHGVEAAFERLVREALGLPVISYE